MPKLCLSTAVKNLPLSIKQCRDLQDNQRLTDQSTMTQVLMCPDLVMNDRAWCETDESFVQFIPYIEIQDSEGRVFKYTRGDGSAESRLVSKDSLGIGGHVDSQPKPGQTLARHLMEEAAREIEEELGIVVQPLDIRITGILCASADAVDRVHLGIHCQYQIPGAVQFIAEDRVIEKGEFLAREDLSADAQWARLETWSKLCVDAARCSREHQAARTAVLQPQETDVQPEPENKE